MVEGKVRADGKVGAKYQRNMHNAREKLDGQAFKKMLIRPESTRKRRLDLWSNCSQGENTTPEKLKKPLKSLDLSGLGIRVLRFELKAS